jgi:hypothetical protein
MKISTILFSLIFLPILFSFQPVCDDELPLNKEIVDFVKSKLKKKVGTGECWDLAAEALNIAKAKWNGGLLFGRVVDYKTDCIYPGDIVQFEQVKVKYSNGKITYEESMDHHTAIIYEVKGTGEYVLAHQNTAYTGRKVGLSTLNFKDITKGKYTVFRPVKE